MQTNNRNRTRQFSLIAQRYDQLASPYSLKRRLEFLQAARGLVLDVGSGTGLLASGLQTTKRVVCVDICLEMCRIVKDRGLQVVCCDAEFLPFKKETFDSVVSSESIFYLDRPDRFVQESRRILRRKGELFLTLFNGKMKVYWKMRNWLVRKGWIQTLVDDVERYIDQSQMLRLLNNEGFKADEVKRAIIFPFGCLDGFNRLLEKTIAGRLSWFILLRAQKEGAPIPVGTDSPMKKR